MRNGMLSTRAIERMKREAALDRSVYRPDADEVGRRVRRNLIRSRALRLAAGRAA